MQGDPIEFENGLTVQAGDRVEVRFTTGDDAYVYTGTVRRATPPYDQNVYLDLDAGDSIRIFETDDIRLT